MGDERLRIEAFQGLETALAMRELDLDAAAEAEIALYLARFVRAADRDLAAGNTSLQPLGGDARRAERRLLVGMAADQIDFAWSEALMPPRRAVKRAAPPASEAAAAEPNPVNAGRIGWGELAPRGGGSASRGGAVLRLDGARPPLPHETSAAISFDATLQARREPDGTLVAVQELGHAETFPHWLLGRLDVLHLGFGIGDAASDGDHAHFASAYYPLLDVGLAPPLAAGSDLEQDLARAYVTLPGEHTRAAFLRELRAGHGFITNGPLLELEVEGQGPGGVVKRDGPAAVRVRARAIGRANFRALELIANGRVVARTESLAVGNHFEAGIAHVVPIDAPAWLALRAAPGDAVNELGAPLFAHTSPVFVEIAAARRFESGVARALALAIDAHARALRRADEPSQTAGSVATCYDAIDLLAERMGWLDWLQLWVVRIARTLGAWLRS